MIRHQIVRRHLNTESGEGYRDEIIAGGLELDVAIRLLKKARHIEGTEVFVTPER